MSNQIAFSNDGVQKFADAITVLFDQELAPHEKLVMLWVLHMLDTMDSITTTFYPSELISETSLGPHEAGVAIKALEARDFIGVGGGVMTLGDGFRNLFAKE